MICQACDKEFDTPPGLFCEDEVFCPHCHMDHVAVCPECRGDYVREVPGPDDFYIVQLDGVEFHLLRGDQDAQE